MISAGEVDIGKIYRLDQLSEMKAKQSKEIKFLLYNLKMVNMVVFRISCDLSRLMDMLYKFFCKLLVFTKLFYLYGKKKSIFCRFFPFSSGIDFKP